MGASQDGQCGFKRYCKSKNAPNGTNNLLLPKDSSCKKLPEPPNIADAIDRLDGFKFVGIEEEWALSVCLFHVALDGECLAVEDATTRKGDYLAPPSHAESAAAAAADPWDAALFSAVKRRFYRDLERYNITSERCKAVCPAFADAFDSVKTDSSVSLSEGTQETYAADDALLDEAHCQASWNQLVERFWIAPGQSIGNLDIKHSQLGECLSRGYDLAGGFSPVEKLLRPSLVITGIGDSGTRGVHDLMQGLGLAVSLFTNRPHDDAAMRPSTLAIPALLQASSGVLTSAAYQQNSGAWHSAVWLERMGAVQSAKLASPAAGQPWGFKSPRTVFLLPVMEEAFSEPVAAGPRTTYLLVARDPRDICTGSNTQQFELYGAYFDVGVDADEARTIAQSELASVACFKFWAKLWRQVLPSLGGTAVTDASSIVVARIEDLVGARLVAPQKPETDGHSGLLMRRALSLLDAEAESADEAGTGAPDINERIRIVSCILQRTGLENQTQANIVTQLNIMHEHVTDYGGNYEHTRAKQQSAVNMLKAMTEVHDVMHALGYFAHIFGRGPPSAKEVITGTQCPQ